MPHSTVDDVVPALKKAEEDIDIPDAPPASSDEADSDGSADGSRERSIEDALSKSGARTQEVKLEEIFNDDDEDDEEFPDSSAPAEDIASSPPADPM